MAPLSQSCGFGRSLNRPHPRPRPGIFLALLPAALMRSPGGVREWGSGSPASGMGVLN